MLRLIISLIDATISIKVILYFFVDRLIMKVIKGLFITLLLIITSQANSFIDSTRCNDFIRQVKEAIIDWKYKDSRHNSRCFLDEGLSYYDEVGNNANCYITETNRNGKTKRFAINYYTSDEKANDNLTYLKNYCVL